MKEALGDAAEVVAETPTDCDQTKGLDAAQDILTANRTSTRSTRPAGRRCWARWRPSIP